MLPATAGDLRMKSVPRAFRPCCRYPQLPISSRTQALEDDKRLPESRAESRPGFSSPAQQSASSICSAETMVLEPARSHVAGRQQVAAVQNQRPAHGVVHALPIEVAELVPLGGNQERFAILRGFVCVFGVLDLRQYRARAPWPRGRIPLRARLPPAVG